VNAFGEKSMLIVTALTLGLIITWLILTDSNAPAASPRAPIGAGVAVSATADKT
jgi:hypothetical protein